MRLPALLFTTVASLAPGLLGCSTDNGAPPEPRPTPSPAAAQELAFDAARAWNDLEAIVGFGPRPAGSKALQRTLSYLEAELGAAGISARREAFTDATPIGDVSFVNLIAELPPTTGTDEANDRVLVLGSHVDTKRLPFRFVGANDGGSSSALLLELARQLALLERGVTYRFVWFDGEESIRPNWSDADSLYGSRHHVEELRSSGELERIGALVLFDLVADRDLALEQDTNSDPRLLRLFVQTAAETGERGLFADYPRAIEDDHLPFRAAGIPAVDLIDLSYGRYNSYWHKPEDVLDNCSKESLERVGKLFLAARAKLESFVQQP